MKKIIKKLISSILLCAVLAGCSNSAASPDPSQPYDGYVSPLRTGTMSQGIRNWANNFECTETGSYFMHSGAANWLLYVDHGSDDVIKLCGRPDCNHTGQDCNAFFFRAQNICYYNGFLYTFEDDPFGADSSLIRMNLDGTERTNVYNLSSFITEEGYQMVNSSHIFNGILFVKLQKIGENGKTVYGNYYYKLDGSMDKPKPLGMLSVEADGESFVGCVDYDKETNIHTFGRWNPDEGAAELYKINADDEFPIGYMGINAQYYIKDGIIFQDSYTDGKKELIDTGLKGNYLLSCFPDCIVVFKYVPTEDALQDITLKEQTLYFYGWDGSSLGSVKINYEFNSSMDSLICGETAERIMLTDNFDFVPRYYINKSDLGTGNIEIHPFNVPDLGGSSIHYD